MKIYSIITIFTTSLSMLACGQTVKNKQKTEIQSSTMDLSKITDTTVKQAIEALQNGDKNWYNFFIENPAMTDDGHSVDFKSFFSNALGKETFLSIDRVENEGKDIYGKFKAGQWGTFPVFFKFYKNAEGKFERLEIGQTK